MSEPKKILLFEFHEETNTFNPLTTPFSRFQPDCVFEGESCYEKVLKSHGMAAGFADAITKAGHIVIPTLFLHASSGGRVQDAVYDHVCERLKYYIETEAFDAVCAALHGATCTESRDDACGELLAYIRNLIGNRPLAAAFDLHANITDTVLKNADIVCGYNTYPHVDLYETGYRAATFCLEKLNGQSFAMASASVAMLIPPSGYTSLSGPFHNLIQKGKEMVGSGKIRDFTVFPVQPWLDIPDIQSRIVTISDNPESAKACADILAEDLFALREQANTKLTSVEEILDIAERNQRGIPVILADSADSPNGGCVGDSPVVAMALQERKSTLRTCMFVVDPEAVKQAFALGVGKTDTFRVGAGFTKGMPGPFVAEGTVRSLHDGYFRPEKNMVKYLGSCAVVSFGSIDILLCCQGGASGSPMIFRSFGMEPAYYDLIVVKANTSFRTHYKGISDLIYVADTPGAGASNLRLFQWEKLPSSLYPFDLPKNYTPEKATLW